MLRILLITTIVFFVPSCLLGMISPVVVKLTLNNLAKTGNVVGRIYAFSTLGSILGTFATGFFLISWMGTRHICSPWEPSWWFRLRSLGGLLSGEKPVSSLLFYPRAHRDPGIVSAYATLHPDEWHVLLPLSESLKMLYEYAFQPPLDDETYYFKESDYYTIKVKKTTNERNEKARNPGTGSPDPLLYRPR